MKTQDTKSIKTKAVMAKADDGTITLTITLPKEDVAKAKQDIMDQSVKTMELPGFRAGKAPREMVEKNLDQEKIREEILKKLLPDFYLAAVKEHNLKPIINPKIHVDKLEPDADWQFSAITCEIPGVKLNNYKDAIKKITAKSKIVLPGKDLPAGRQESQKPNFDEIMKAMVDNISVKIPSILIEGEVDRLLSQLLSEIKSLGLSLDQYLASTNKSVEQLKAEYQTKAENDIKVEFALQKIAEEENITVEQKEIDEAIQKAKDEKERKQLESNMYLLANILRQQKTLDFLKNL